MNSIKRGSERRLFHFGSTFSSIIRAVYGVWERTGGWRNYSFAFLSLRYSQICWLLRFYIKLALADSASASPYTFE